MTKIEDNFMPDFIRLSVRLATMADQYIEFRNKKNLAGLDAAQKTFWRFMRANMSEVSGAKTTKARR